MVTDKKTIAISSLIVLGLIIASTVTISYFDSPKYYCEAKSAILECPGGLSGGLGTRCYINSEKTSYNTCSSGWLKITNDLNITESEPEQEPIPNYSGAKKYSCDQTKCVQIE